ncbi:MAG TPA: hypothetical protein VFK10_19900, partial [Burkholderiaceae bacterium]|nr:hypothetical protein [Burkholderiaceae bacterium]
MKTQLFFRATLLLAGCAALAPAFAQQGKSPAAAELRPVYATVPDIMEGKRVADVSCARCHGSNGVSNAAGMPHIAG